MNKISNLVLLIGLILPVSVLSQTFKTYINNDWQDSRYTDNGNETITDKTTNLMWKKCAEGFSGNTCAIGSEAVITNWQTALELATANATFAGYSNWRLPNIKELLSLSAFDRLAPAINLNMFPNTGAEITYLSATPSMDDDTDTHAIHTSEGRILRKNGVYSGNTPNVRIRLVRDTQ